MEHLLDEISVESIWSHIENLSKISPQRLSGTGEEEKAAQYIKETWESFGLPVTIHEFEGLVSYPVYGELRITEPEKKTLKCSVFAQIASTMPEGLEGELVYLGSGSLQDYVGKDVRGKIVLVDLSSAPPRPEKVRLASIHGAAAVIMANWGLSEHDCLPLGTVKAVWGNPTPETISQMPTLPVLGITKAAGEYLTELLETARVRVWMRAEATREWRKILLPIAKLKGKKESTKFVVVGGHYDAWAAGVTCNATGNAVGLELARIFSKNKNRLNRSIYFVFFPGHENGIMEGSTWFADNYWDDLNRNAIMYINLDSPGMKNCPNYWTFSSAEARRLHQQVESQLIDVPTRSKRLAKVGDQSFFGIGIPALWALSVPADEDIENWGGAWLAWWYHSSKDTLDKACKEVLQRDIKAYVGYIWRLCTDPVLPFEFVSVADEIGTRFEALNNLINTPIKFDDLLQKTARFRLLAEKLDVIGQTTSCQAQIDRINETLIKLSRVTTWVRATDTDRYNQDNYGLSHLGNTLPSLGPLEDLVNMDASSQEYKLWLTKLVRQRNKCSDVLDSAIGYLENEIPDVFA